MTLKRKLLLPTAMLAASLLLTGGLLALVQTGAAAATPAATPAAKAAAPVATTTPVASTESNTSTGSATAASADAVERPAGWSAATHGSSVKPDAAVVFPADRVNTITITVNAENYAAMQADMTELYGEKGTGRSGFGGPNAGGPGLGGQPPADGDAPAGVPQGPAGGQRPPGEGLGGGMGGEFTTENPIWVTSTVEFDGSVWTNVGIRYKGNSSLMSSWNSGSLKLPFKLDFDEFEDIDPAIDNQRFFGYQQLSFGNNFSDSAMLRDALAYDVYEAAGLVAANTGFYEVYLDYGEGPVRLGLYTAVEVIDDTVVERAFGDDSGNLYEGEGRNVSLAAGTTAEQIEESFQKENNEDAADWSDIAALYAVLHSDLRTEDPAAWRAELEAVFDVDTFLKWLAVSAQIGHWDTYGAMAHNFYLYDDPATGQLTWISWDHNMTFSGGMGGGMGRPLGNQPAQRAITATLPVTAATAITATATTTATAATTATAPAAPVLREGRGFGGPGGGRSVSLDKADVTAQWPLIRFLLDDPVYNERYIDFMAETSELVTPEAIGARVQAYAAVLAPYAEPEIDDTAYADALQQIIDYVTTRAVEVRTFLAAQ